jgi:hypothetical protein
LACSVFGDRPKDALADPDKIRELARRGEAFGSSESRQMLEYAISVGRGGIYLKLTSEQYAHLKRPWIRSETAMSGEKKICPSCGTEMEWLIDVIKPESIFGCPGLAVDGSTVTGSRSARYDCPGCAHIELYPRGRGTWTIVRNVGNA